MPPSFKNVLFAQGLWCCAAIVLAHPVRQCWGGGRGRWGLCPLFTHFPTERRAKREYLSKVGQKWRHLCHRKAVSVWPTVDTTAHLCLQRLFFLAGCACGALWGNPEQTAAVCSVFVNSGFYWLQLLTIAWLLLATSWIILCKYVCVHTLPMCSKHAYRESCNERMKISWMQTD